MTSDILLWKTHCDTIGDFFKNPILYRYIKEYYESTYTNIEWWPLRKGKSFTPQFYNCVRDIFSNYAEMKEFLRRLRIQYKEDASMITHFTDDQLTQTLLVFEQLYQSFSNSASESFTVAWLFKKSVVDIVLERKREFIELDREEPEKGTLDSKNSLYTWLLDAIKAWIAITSDGEIVYLQWKIKENVFTVVELGSFDEKKVNSHGTIILPFEKPKFRVVSENTEISWGKNAAWWRGKIQNPGHLKSIK